MREVNYSEISRTRKAVEAKRKRIRLKIFLSIILIMVVGVVVYLHITKEEVIEENIEGLNVQLQSNWTNYEDSLQHTELEIKEVTQEDIELRIEDYIKSMSLENKISQLIITTPESLIGISQVVQAGTATKKKIYQYPVGGLIFSDKNFDTVTQIQEMVNSILIYNPYPLFIILDEVASTRVENTNTKLSDINVNMTYENQKLYTMNKEEKVEVKDLLVDTVDSEKKAIESLKGETVMLVVPSDYEKYHKKIYNAVMVGEVTEEEIDDKLRTILEYKITSI